MDSRKSSHDHTPEEERRIRDAALDETIEDSFPASDPPSSLPNPDDHAAAKRRQRGGDARQPPRPDAAKPAEPTT